MPHKRILSLWFPRMGAEQVLRQMRGTYDGPLAIVDEDHNMQVVSSLSAAAAAEGLNVGQPLRDAQAMCPALLTRQRNAQAEAGFLMALRRWAGKFSPWVADEPPNALVVDLTGCAHLFGGEEALLAVVEADCAELGLTVHAGVADTVGAAWALARFAGQPLPLARTGDAIDQEAYATRARAVKRRNWERGGPAPALKPLKNGQARIAAPGQTRQAIAPLPVAALRLEGDTAVELARLGLRRVDDLAGQPRAALARRFGRPLVQRLDQALGVEPEPVSPAKPPVHFAVRLSLPDPIGLEEDIIAAIDRILPRFCEKLEDKGLGARRIRMECQRVDQEVAVVEVGLARPSANPDRIRPLLVMKLGDIDAGYGIDRVRIEASVTEVLHKQQHRGHFHASADNARHMTENTALDDLIGKVGARIGLEAITRPHPADSHIPEKAVKVLAAAWSGAVMDWPVPEVPRPILLWRPEMVTADDVPDCPMTFRWRQRTFATRAAAGPERIAPEWWLDEPDWRTGIRDYWRVTTETGERLWLYFAHGGTKTGGWFCQGAFA